MCPDCGLPHPSSNPYCFCMTPTASISDANKAAEDFAHDFASALTEAQATIARLREALEPFAEAAEECDDCGYDDNNQAPIDAGQCRAARAALSPQAQEG